MTTNIIDLDNGVAASDSRWSISQSDPDDPFVIYIDDSGFKKIMSCDGICLVFAGYSALIAKWKEWLWYGRCRGEPRPGTQMRTGKGEVYSIALHIVRVKDKQLLFQRNNDAGKRLTFDASCGRVFFAGSGGLPAREEWLDSRNAETAVARAIGVDTYSGGNVRYLYMPGGRSNLVENHSHQGMLNAFAEKGSVMFTKRNQNESFPVKEVAANDSRVKEIIKSVASGEMSPVAPFEGMDQPWSEEEESALDKALEEAFGVRL